MLQQPLTPAIVRIVEAPTPEIGVADLLIKSFGIVGLVAGAAILGGAVLGGLFVLLKVWRPDNPINGQVSHGWFDLSSPVADDARTDDREPVTTAR
jgi:hypothetical protein